MTLDLTKLKPRKPTPKLKSAPSAPNWSMFDKIVCVHFLPYKERLVNIKDELQRVGILNNPGFEWHYTVDNPFYKYVMDGIPKDKIDLSPGGVNMANIKYTIDSFNLLLKLQQSGCERALVVEDDVFFHNDLEFIKHILDVTPADFDVMNYDPWVYGNDVILNRVNDNVCRYAGGKVYLASCIGFSKRAINQIIENDKKVLRPFDHYTCVNTGTLNTYCVDNSSHLCLQHPYNTRQTYCPFYKNIDFSKYNLPKGSK